MKRLGLVVFVLSGLAGCLAAVLGGVSNVAVLVGMGLGLALMWLADLPTTESNAHDSLRRAHR